MPEPAWRKPTDEQFYVTDIRGVRRPNTEFLKQHFFKEGRITDEQVLYLLNEASNLMVKEPNLLQVQEPITGAYRT